MLEFKVLTKNIKNIEFKYNNNNTHNHKQQSWFQKILFTIILFVLYIGWIWIQIKRGSGAFYDSVCQRFEIKFDDYEFDYFREYCNDSNNSKCPASWIGRTDSIRYTSFNDVYEAVRDQDGTVALYNQRPVYTQRGLTGTNAFGTDSPPGKIFYCIEEEAWVFTIEGVDKGVVDQNDGGCNWLMKSLQTDAHSLHQVDTTGWIVWTGLLDVVKDFSISCIECGTISINETLDIGCTYHGRCVNEKCVCDRGWMGSQCGNCVSCSEIDVFDKASQGVTRYRRFEKLDPSTNMLTSMQVYGRPIYYKVDVFSNIDPSLFVIFYDGGRYVAWDLKEGDRVVTERMIEGFFEVFHSTWSFSVGTEVLFVSEITDAPMPFGLKWKNEVDENGNLFELDVSCPNEQERNACRFYM